MPKKKRDNLILRLACRIQEHAFSGLSDRTEEHLEQLMRMNQMEKERANEGPKRLNRPAAGIRLVRQNQEIEHHVTVTRNGFEYQGRTFRSFNRIARQITGTPWSGPLFFGLMLTDMEAK